MAAKEQIQNDPKFHSNTLGANSAAGSMSTAIVFHNADVAGAATSVASPNDTTSSDRNSSHFAASASPTAQKSVLVTVAGSRISNPA